MVSFLRRLFFRQSGWPAFVHVFQLYPAQHCVRSSYLPHSLMVDSGEESEVGMMSEHNAEQDTVERHARKRAIHSV